MATSRSISSVSPFGTAISTSLPDERIKSRREKEREILSLVYIYICEKYRSSRELLSLGRSKKFYYIAVSA